MPKTTPHLARMGKRRRARPGNLADLQRELWHCLRRAMGVLDGARDDETILKAVHAVSQLAGQYVRLTEAGELEARLAALEAEVQKHAQFSP